MGRVTCALAGLGVALILVPQATARVVLAPTHSPASAAVQGEARYEPTAAFADNACLLNPGGCPRIWEPMGIMTRGTVTTGALPTSAPTPVTTNTKVTPMAPPKSMKIRVVCTQKRKVCRTFKGPTLVKKCVRASGRLTCTFYDPVMGKPYKRCVTRHGKKRCVKLGKTPKALDSSALRWQGFHTAMPAVGQLISIYPGNNVGTCTATAVTKGLLITAGHCIYHGGWAEKVGFVPGQLGQNHPYGVWLADSWWAPTGWTQGDPGLDMGIVRIPFGSCIADCPAPALSSWIGDYVGSWSITANIQYGAQSRMYLVGYPGAGYWSTEAGGKGLSQWACDTSYDYEYAHGGIAGTGYYLWDRCSMNHGASGGPQFVQLSNNSWTIGGVNNVCFGGGVDADGKPCQPYGDWIGGLYFNETFIQFWNSVIAAQ